MNRLLLSIVFLFSLGAEAQPIRVGAKHFNEGYILSEIISQLLEHHGFQVQRVYNLGGTLVSFEALRTGAIDVYPEYTGTITSEILKSNKNISQEEMKELLRESFEMEISSPFGFNNSYGLVMLESTASLLSIGKISDLQKHPDLVLGLSYEYLKRQDGWEALSRHYGLTLEPVGLEHGLAYEALRSKKIEITDAYTTDGEISVDHLAVLEDDLDFFPRYDAVALYSKNLNSGVKRILESLDGLLKEEDIQQMNASVLFEKKSFSIVANAFLVRHQLVPETNYSSSIWKEILSKTGTHLLLTFIALLIAILVAVPLGISLYLRPAASRPILYITGLLQTIPSIALLAMMIPLLGIGFVPALVALFLYALLPILRSTITGLQSVDPILKNVSQGMGMSRSQQLRWVEFPLASPIILSGIRTASIINVGTATLAAFIGAGGLGEFIVAGLALNDSKLILQGAIPAALLAILMELLFEGINLRIVPKHLR